MVIFSEVSLGAIAHNHVSLKRASECDTQLAAVPAASSVITLHTYIKNLYSAKIVKRIRGALAFNSSLQRCSASIRLAVLSRCCAWTLLQLQMALEKNCNAVNALHLIEPFCQLSHDLSHQSDSCTATRRRLRRQPTDVRQRDEFN